MSQDGAVDDGSLADVQYAADPALAHLAWITLDRPQASNAYSEAMIDSLCRALDRAEDDDNIWAVALTGAGRSFSAGGDLKAMLHQTGMFAGDSIRLRTRYTRAIQRVPRRLSRFEKPVIAAVQGPAIGAGLDLCCMADFRIASTEARFGSTFARVGLVPGDGGAYFLSRTIGYPQALRLILTARIVEPFEALGLGLVHEVVDPEQLASAVRRLASELFQNAPLAVRLAKQACSRSWGASLEHALDLAATYQALSQRTADHREGVGALLEKRAADFKGE